MAFKLESRYFRKGYTSMKIIKKLRQSSIFQEKRVSEVQLPSTLQSNEITKRKQVSK